MPVQFVFKSQNPKPTEVFDCYWHFAAERQAIFFNRLENRPFPWTIDPILREFRFTNVYRASDRVSQYLIRNVIYRGNHSPENVFFRILLFKLFNKVETWELLESCFEELVYSSSFFYRTDRLLSAAILSGRRIYSAAYIMPSGGDHYDRKHSAHLMLLKNMMRDDLPLKVADCKTMRQCFDLLKSYPMIGDFLAYQYAIDINYSTLTNFSEMDLVVPGPGARSGLRKCFADFGCRSEEATIQWVAERQAEEFVRLGLSFKTLWGRPLQLIDCQNLFCEVDKYSRVRFPELNGKHGRRRIKQKFKPDTRPLDLWFPPKWGLNAGRQNASEVPLKTTCA